MIAADSSACFRGERAEVATTTSGKLASYETLEGWDGKLYFTEPRELVEKCHVDISQGAWTIHTQGATMLGFSDLCFTIDPCSPHFLPTN